MEWSPRDSHSREAPFLLTIKHDLEVKLWKLPSSMGVLYMEEVADLLPLLQSSPLFSEYGSPIVFCSCHFLSPFSLILSWNCLLFSFSLTWTDGTHSYLLPSLEWSVKCSDVITSTLPYASHLLCGTLHGRVISVSPPSTQPSMLVESISDAAPTNEKRVQNDSTAEEAVLLSSILQRPHPCQGAIKELRSEDDLVLISDGIHIGCYRFESATTLVRVSYYTEIEGIGVIGGSFHSCPILTASYSYHVVDLVTSSCLSSSSLLPFFSSLTDFSLLGGISSSFAPQTLLFLCYYQTAPKSTTVDYRVQALALNSLTLSSPHCRRWLPLAVLSPTAIRSTLQTSWEAVEKGGAICVDSLHLLYIWLCHQLHTGGKWKLTENASIDSVLTLRKRLLCAAYEHREDAKAKWVRCKVNGDHSQQVPIEEVCRKCECCGMDTVLDERHQDYCVLQSIDQYCLYSWKPIVGCTNVLICPCCCQQYLEGERCIFCGLSLCAVKTGPPLADVINNRFLCAMRTE